MRGDHESPATGTIFILDGVDKAAHDFVGIYECAVHFAATGKNVDILPKLHPKSTAYRQLFADLLGTHYEGKSPDLRTIEDGQMVYYEHEGFEIQSRQENRLRNKLSRGLHQASRLIIDDEGSTLNHITKVINFRIKTGDRIDEVWIRRAGGLLVQAYERRKPNS